jgi:hypothetical protein
MCVTGLGNEWSVVFGFEIIVSHSTLLPERRHAENAEDFLSGSLNTDKIFENAEALLKQCCGLRSL